MIAATLSVFTLAGVLSAFLLIGRTSFNAHSYSTMEGEIRLALERFGEDARLASDVRWHDSRHLVLLVPAADGTVVETTYAFESPPGSTRGVFYRQIGDQRRNLVHDVAPDFTFARYKLEQPGVDDNTAQNDLETKLIALTLRTFRAPGAGAIASQTATSTRYLLRNKTVGQ